MAVPTVHLTRIRNQLEQCRNKLAQGSLMLDDLQTVIDALDEARPKVQDILYIQATGTALESPVLGMSLYTNGRRIPLPSDRTDWPYQSVIEAVRDGWRIISFPNMALMMDDSATYGLGCEFILER
jgi:hypothetical protein